MYAGIVTGIIASQLSNVYPVLVGLAGTITLDWYFPVIGATVVPLFVLNVIVYVFLVYL